MGGNDTLEDALEIVSGEEVNDDPASLVVSVLKDGDASAECLTELALKIHDVRRPGFLGPRSLLAAAQAVRYDSLCLADGEVVGLDAGGKAPLFLAVRQAEECPSVAHRECST